MVEHVRPHLVPDVASNEYGWGHVAQEMGDWHPDLRVHAERLVEAHGGTRPVTPEAPAPAGHAEAPAPHAGPEAAGAPETIPTKEIAEAFIGSHRGLFKMSNDPQFHARCMERGVDPYVDMDKSSYWTTFTDYAHERIAALRAKHGDSLQLSSFELVSAAPSFFFESFGLHKGQHTPAERRHGKEVASSFNERIRTFAAKFPETSVNNVATSLLNAANVALEDRNAREYASQTVREMLWGAQHESAFGQILDKTKHSSRPARRAEDLRGIDRVVDETTAPLYIDVKASLKEVVAHGGEGAYAIRPDGNIVMYSLVTSAELGDRFFISDEAATKKAPVLEQQLEQARRQMLQATA